MQKTAHLSEGTKVLIAALVLAGVIGLGGTAFAGSAIDGDMFNGVVTTHTVKKHESLFDIARKYDMGIIELEAANPGVSPWQPKPGTVINVSTRHVIPSITHDGIVVNLTASRLFYFKGPNEVVTYPVASGKEGWETPVAATKVVEKRLHPTWTIPEDIRAEDPSLPESVPPGPGNPLGDYALALGLSGIMIHGTTTPSSIGKHASHGCIRMYPEDIESLFKAVKKGTPVLLTRTPYILGWQGNKLYLEVPPRVHQPVKLKKGQVAKKPKPDKLLHDAVTQVAGNNASIDWDKVDETMARGDGMPAEIGSRAFSLFGPPMPPRPEQRASLTIINDGAVSMR